MADEVAREVRPFTQFLHEQRRGALHDDLGFALADLCNSVVEHGKQGELVIKLRVKPSGDGMVQITDSVMLKAPVGEKAPSMFWVDKGGNVHRSNPAQSELPLRSIDGERQVG